MSFGVVYCPSTIEVGQAFEVTLRNTLLHHSTKIGLQIVCDTQSGERHVGLPGIDFDGQLEMSGPEVSAARFAWHPLGFLEGSENKTWILKFRLTRAYPYDNVAVVEERSIQVLPASEVDKKDAKPVDGVYRQITPDGPAPGA